MVVEQATSWFCSACNVSVHCDDNRGVTETEAVPRMLLEETFREQRAALVRLAYLMCGSREQAEDLVQTAFTAAQERGEGIENLPAYLRRTIVNRAKDAQRRHFRLRRILPRLVEDPVTLQPELDHTWAVIRSLPLQQRTVIVLHYYEDLPLVEISDLLGRPASTVRSDLHRAHANLRKALS
jgi:RNA polymerase sigma factor (sigma-70 family)